MLTGLQKPPAGSGRGRRGEGNGPVGISLLIWAGASPFHTGGCATSVALLPSYISWSPGGCSETTPGRRGSSPPSLSWFLKHQEQPVFPLDPVLYWERKGEKEKGGRGAPPKHLTKANTQQSNFSCWVPRRQEPPWPSWYSASAPLPGLPQLCSWCSFTFSANNLQMVPLISLAYHPPLSKTEERRGGKEPVMTVCDLAGSLGGHIGFFPRERLTSTGGKRTSALQNPREAAGTQDCSQKWEFSILRLSGGTQHLMRLQCWETTGPLQPFSRNLLACLTACLMTKKKDGPADWPPNGASHVCWSAKMGECPQGFTVLNYTHFREEEKRSLVLEMWIRVHRVPTEISKFLNPRIKNSNRDRRAVIGIGSVYY